MKYFQDVHVNRWKYHERITDGLLHNNSVLLVGEPGIGKSFIAQEYADLNPLKFDSIQLFKGLALNSASFNKNLFALSHDLIGKGYEQLYIIDGIDEIESAAIRSEVYKLIKEGVKYGLNVLATTRPVPTEKVFFANSHIINLSGFAQTEVKQLVTKLYHGDINTLFSKDGFDKLIAAIGDNPLGVYSIIDLLNSSYLTGQDIADLLLKNLHYEGDQDGPVSSQHELWLPSDEAIIDNISFVKSTLLHAVKQDINLLYTMPARKFEEFIAELFEKQGYNVTLTQQTKDGGKDLILTDRNRLTNHIYYVECKRNAKHNHVGVGIVRQLFGTVSRDRVTAGIVVTSSHFTNAAIKFTEPIKAQLTLLDYYNLKKWIQG